VGLGDCTAGCFVGGGVKGVAGKRKGREKDLHNEVIERGEKQKGRRGGKKIKKRGSKNGGTGLVGSPKARTSGGIRRTLDAKDGDWKIRSWNGGRGKLGKRGKFQGPKP